MHLGGKIEVSSKVPVKTRDDLSMAYTPGVARVCQAIARRPGEGMGADHQAQHGRGRDRRHRGARPRRHRPAAAMPVMEGKAMLFKEFAGVDAFPLCLATPGRRRDRRVRQGGRARRSAASTSRTSPRRAASRSSGVSRASSTSRSSTTTSTAPRSSCSRRCSTRCASSASAAEDITRRRRSAPAPPASRAPRSSSPTASATWWSATSRARCTPGAAGLDPKRERSRSARTPSDGAAPPTRCSPAPTCSSASPGRGAVSRRRRCARWRTTRSSSRWPTRSPRSGPRRSAPDVAIMATGRSDYPNQINNVLAFPGVFRGALDVRATRDQRGDEARRGAAPSPA